MNITGFRLGTAHSGGNPTTTTENFYPPSGHILAGFMSRRNERHFYHSFAMRPIQVLINTKWYTINTI